MGYPNKFKIIFAVFCLLVTGILLNARPDSLTVVKTTTLSETFISFGSWKSLGEIPLELKIQEALFLDDYLFQRYTDGSDIVTLYIGYYYTSSKVGAAHDPLVCFPGQGWVLSNRDSSSTDLFSDSQKYSVNYATMQAEQSGQKEALLYWFQAQDETVSDTLSQKIILLWEKFSNGREENAFVRLSIDMQGKSYEQYISILNRFLESFYPDFHQYVQSVQAPGLN
jgi:EpsI family protein